MKSNKITKLANKFIRKLDEKRVAEKQSPSRLRRYGAKYLSEDDKKLLVNLLSHMQGITSGLVRATGDSTPPQSGSELLGKLRSDTPSITVDEAKQIASQAFRAINDNWDSFKISVDKITQSK